MQPYLFPYLGYFNLVKASDYFVFYDDVNFIKKGWIHRNRIIINGHEHLFTVPLHKSGQNLLINQINISNYSEFRTDFIRKITFAYKKAPFFEHGLYYLNDVFNDEFVNINELAINSVFKFCKLLEIETKFFRSSISFPETIGVGKAERLIQISHKLGVENYINAAGGKHLYCKEHFSNHGLNLQFLIPKLDEYTHFNSEAYKPGLSIIDVLMNVPLADVARMINAYELE